MPLRRMCRPALPLRASVAPRACCARALRSAQRRSALPASPRRVRRSRPRLRSSAECEDECIELRHLLQEFPASVPAPARTPALLVECTTRQPFALREARAVRYALVVARAGFHEARPERTNGRVFFRVVAHGHAHCRPNAQSRTRPRHTLSVIPGAGRRHSCSRSFRFQTEQRRHGIPDLESVHRKVVVVLHHDTHAVSHQVVQQAIPPNRRAAISGISAPRALNVVVCDVRRDGRKQR